MRESKNVWLLGVAVLLSGCATKKAGLAEPADPVDSLSGTLVSAKGVDRVVPLRSAVHRVRVASAYESPLDDLGLGGAIDSGISLNAVPAAADAEPVAMIETPREEDVSPMEPLPPVDPATAASEIVPIDLGSALAIVGGQIPVVGEARWRVQEAYARLDQAKVLWLPTIQAGFSFNRHDGNLQASDGSIVDVNRNSFQYGLGAAAVGAGTSQRPGVLAQFHVADALFEPKIAQKTAWAACHASNAVTNQQLLEVALAYMGALRAHQDHQIVVQSRDRTGELSQLTDNFASAGQGLQADADRLRTELTLVETRLATAQEEVEVASARLAERLSLPPGQIVAPTEPTVVPIEMVSLGLAKSDLISRGLRSRPELKESQALVVAACDEYARQKYSPFVPSVLLGFSTGGFGGGLGNNLNDVESRYDFDAVATWGVRNLGLGEKAVRREAASRIQRAKFDAARVLDQVAREVSEAHSQTVNRAQRITIAERAIQTAQDSYDRNLSRIRDGQGLPLEVLQSARALEEAQRAYMSAVVDYNEAQFRLHWALGWPTTALAN